MSRRQSQAGLRSGDVGYVGTGLGQIGQSRAVSRRSRTRSDGNIGRRNFVDGNSHETLPAYFAAHPDACFDLITVDRDYSPDGATQDLTEVLPRTRLGGAVVFLRCVPRNASGAEPNMAGHGNRGPALLMLE